MESLAGVLTVLAVWEQDYSFAFSRMVSFGDPFLPENILYLDLKRSEVVDYSGWFSESSQLVLCPRPRASSSRTDLIGHFQLVVKIGHPGLEPGMSQFF